MGQAISCLDPVQDQTAYSLSRKHVGRAESIAEYKARKNADKLKILKKELPGFPPVSPVVVTKELPEKLSEVTSTNEEEISTSITPEKTDAPDTTPDAITSVDEPISVLPEKPDAGIATEDIPEKPDAVIPEEEEKIPDVLVSGPIEVDEKVHRALPNDEILPFGHDSEIVAGSTDEIPAANGIAKEVPTIIPPVVLDDSASLRYKETETVAGATQEEETNNNNISDPIVKVDPVEVEDVVVPKPRPVSAVSNVSEVPEFPELSENDGLLSPTAEATALLFADKSYAHPELGMDTKVQDPVTGQMVTVDEYRARSSQRASKVKEYVNLYEQIDESAMKEKEEVEKQRIARGSQRNIKPAV